jgi:acid stress-induced BolA-like protein IbaG/YrbA
MVPRRAEIHDRSPPAPMERPMDPSRIQALIEDGLPGARVEVAGADGVHFEATVVASQFAGKLPLARHRLVYATLGDLMGGAIHALALKTLTPQEAGMTSRSAVENRDS